MGFLGLPALSILREHASLHHILWLVHYENLFFSSCTWFALILLFGVVLILTLDLLVKESARLIWQIVDTLDL